MWHGCNKLVYRNMLSTTFFPGYYNLEKPGDKPVSLHKVVTSCHKTLHKFFGGIFMLLLLPGTCMWHTRFVHDVCWFEKHSCCIFGNMHATYMFPGHYQHATWYTVCYMCVVCYVHVACMYCMSCSFMWLSYLFFPTTTTFLWQRPAALIVLWVNVVVYVVNQWLHDWQPRFMVSSKSLYQTTRCPANAWKFDRNQEQHHIEQTALECDSNRIAQCAYVKRKVRASLVYWRLNTAV